MERKLGIIGYGGIGVWHAENIKNRISGLKVGGVYDIDEKRRKKARLDGYETYDSAEELLHSDVDLILVATPNNFHKKYCIQALNCGKNVVCEKPVCLNMQELNHMFVFS